MKWEPIETAPLDATMVLLWHRNGDGVTGAYVLGWYDQAHGWEDYAGGLVDPVAWMPLPEPPMSGDGR